MNTVVPIALMMNNTVCPFCAVVNTIYPDGTERMWLGDQAFEAAEQSSTRARNFWLMLWFVINAIAIGLYFTGVIQ